jgi:hypothetical protein
LNIQGKRKGFMNAAGLLLLIFLNGTGNISSGTDYRLLIEYNLLGEHKPKWEAYSQALRGYKEIQEEQNLNENKPYLTIIDFTLPSFEKRLWLIDMASNKILYYTYVAHGKNSGGIMAERFSNTPQSYQSSLGFYLTGDTYHGKNGYSLYLRGLEKGINDKAMDRAIVMHGAWYANESMIKKFGRLGRSYGCPSIPENIHKEVINSISHNTILFIYHSSKEYQTNSRFLLDSN